MKIPFQSKHGKPMQGRWCLPPMLLALCGLFVSGSVRAHADMVYVSFGGNSNTIGTFDSAQAGGDSTFGTFPSTNLANATGIAFDTAGYLYVANANNGTITKFDPAGNASQFASGVSLSAPSGLAFDQFGYLYVSNDNGQIVKISPAGTGTVFATITGKPAGLAFDSLGNLYVADSLNSQIIQISSTGNKNLFADNNGFTTLNKPMGLTFDARGDLYVANWDSSLNTIEKFSSTGVALGVFASQGLGNPTGLAFDSSGNLFVANYQHTGPLDHGYSTIVQFSSTGALVKTFYDSTYGPSDGLHDANFIAIRSAPEPSTWVLVSIGITCLSRRPSRAFRKP